MNKAKNMKEKKMRKGITKSEVGKMIKKSEAKDIKQDKKMMKKMKK